MRRFFVRAFLILVVLCPMMWFDISAQESWARDWRNA